MLELDINNYMAHPFKFVHILCIYIHNNYESHVASLVIA